MRKSANEISQSVKHEISFVVGFSTLCCFGGGLMGTGAEGGPREVQEAQGGRGGGRGPKGGKGEGPREGGPREGPGWEGPRAHCAQCYLRLSDNCCCHWVITLLS